MTNHFFRNLTKRPGISALWGGIVRQKSRLFYWIIRTAFCFFSVLGTSFVCFINMYFWVFKFLVFEMLYQPLLEENE